MNELIKRIEDGLVEEKTRQAIAIYAPDVDPDNIRFIVMGLVKENDYLAKCSPASIIGSVVRGTQLGLSFQKNLGHAYLVPYKGIATLIIGYRGFTKLAFNSGKISTIDADVVCVGDTFEWEKGTDGFLKHKHGDERGEVTHAWCMVTMTSGHRQFDVMSVKELNKIRNANPNWQRTPWNGYYNEMAKKTVFRRLAKYLPLSIEAQDVLANEDNGHDYGAELFPEQVHEEPIDVDYSEARKPQSLDDFLDDEQEAPFVSEYP